MQHPLDYESRDKKVTCPFCQSTATASGDLVAGDADAVRFVPHNLPKLARLLGRGGVLITQMPVACTDCGALWSAVEVSRLREVLERSTKDGAK